MLTWENLDILSYGAGTPSTTLALMSCENAMRGKPYPYPYVPVNDAVIFCDLHSEPKVVYTSQEYMRDCFHKRNRHLVDNSSVCVCYQTRETGGTSYTTAYAKTTGVEVLNIAP